MPRATRDFPGVKDMSLQEQSCSDMLILENPISDVARSERRNTTLQRYSATALPSYGSPLTGVRCRTVQAYEYSTRTPPRYRYEYEDSQPRAGDEPTREVKCNP